jgi:hypothetical protein
MNQKIDQGCIKESHTSLYEILTEN